MKPLHLILYVAASAAVAMANTAGSLSVPQSEPLLPVKNQSAAEPQSQDSTLEPGEARIRAGIVLQGILHDTLAGVRDKETAEAATGPIMRLSREMQEWARGFAALPPLDEETRNLYEEKYLPTIRQMNNHIKAQGERIAAAEFYGSQNLPAALVRLIQSMQ